MYNPAVKHAILEKEHCHVKNGLSTAIVLQIIIRDTGGAGTKGMIAYAQEKGLNVLVVDCTAQKGS